METILKIVLLVIFVCLIFAIIFILPEVIPAVGIPLMACTGYSLFLAVVGFIVLIVIAASR